MRKYIALLLALALLLAACGTAQPPETEPPTTEPPATEPPATEPPATEPPATEPPATEPPETEPPATEPPATEPPATDPPATEPPATEPPATEPPATEPPATEPPATEPPATEPPATEPPVTEPPATEPPATEPPATEPPATEPPATEPPATEPPAEVELTIDTDYIEMYTGDTAAITATYSGSTGSPSWSSSDPSVATVADGTVTATGDGVAIISAAYGDKIAQCVISVSQKVEDTEPEIGPAVSVVKSGNNGSWSIGCVGNSLNFNATAKTSDGNFMGVTASSSNTGVATVSCSTSGTTSSVTVSFKSSGSVTITLTSVDGAASTSFTINVRGYSAQNASTPEAFAAACNYVIGMNDRSVVATGSYTVATLSDDQLTWSRAVGTGQGAASRSWSNGHSGAAVTYEGVNEEGLHVFHIHT